MNEQIQALLLPRNYTYGQTNQVQQQTETSGLDFQQLLMEKIALAQSFNLQGGLDHFADSIPALSMITQTTSPFAMNMHTTYSQQPIEAPMQMNKAISAYNTTKANPVLAKAPTSRFNDIISNAAQKYGVDENIIHAIIKMESNYDPTVRSHAGAVGLMQLMPGTARELGVTDPRNVKENIEGGTKYFSQMLKRHKGNIPLALASYNAGPGNVQKYGGIPPFKETQNYVRKVMDYYHA